MFQEQHFNPYKPVVILRRQQSSERLTTSLLSNQLSAAPSMQFGSDALVTGLLSTAQTNNIIFYEVNTCNSEDYGGYNIGSGTCCVTKLKMKQPWFLSLETLWTLSLCSLEAAVELSNACVHSPLLLT